MNWKGLVIFAISLTFCFVLTILETKITFASIDSKSRICILLAEITTYFTSGWLWFLPLILLSSKNIYEKVYLRIPILFTPAIICMLYYRSILSGDHETMDPRLYAGYIYQYGYYAGLFFDIVLTMLTIIIINETILLKKKRKALKGE
jgi:hypothetical protein